MLRILWLGVLVGFSRVWPRTFDSWLDPAALVTGLKSSDSINTCR